LLEENLSPEEKELLNNSDLERHLAPAKEPLNVRNSVDNDPLSSESVRPLGGTDPT
jgi:hypothetical protein